MESQIPIQNHSSTRHPLALSKTCQLHPPLRVPNTVIRSTTVARHSWHWDRLSPIAVGQCSLRDSQLSIKPMFLLGWQQVMRRPIENANACRW